MSTASTASFCVGPDHAPDKYRLLKMVGGGGEAQLWQAALTVAGSTEPVAVKVLRPEHLGDFARLSARWSEQAELLRFVRHPGVVGVREHFEGAPLHAPGDTLSDERQLYLVMNWVEGLSIREWAVLHHGPRATLQVLQHLDQIAEVLDLLHSGRATPGGRALVHGDLSPGNVMIDQAGQAILVDFGLIRINRYRTKGPMGTQGYAAPEVWSAGEYSPAADRYSFGALAYFALTGTPPVGNYEQIRAGLTSNPLLASRNPASIALLLTIFSDDPSQRPPSTLQWVRLLRNTATTTAPPNYHTPLPATATELVRSGNHTPLLSRPDTPSITDRQGRRGRRAAAALAATVAVAGAVTVGAIAIRPPVGGSVEVPGTSIVITPTPSATAQEQRAPVSSSPRPARAETQRFAGEVLVSGSLDLDENPPRNVGSAGGGTSNDIRRSGSSLIVSRFSSVARWNIRGQPTRAQCADAVTRLDLGGGYSFDDAEEGLSFCLLTNKNRVTFAKAQESGSDGYLLDVIVWDN